MQATSYVMADSKSTAAGGETFTLTQSASLPLLDAFMPCFVEQL